MDDQGARERLEDDFLSLRSCSAVLYVLVRLLVDGHVAHGPVVGQLFGDGESICHPIAAEMRERSRR